MRPRIASISSCGSPARTIRPSTMIAICEHRSVTSSTMWVDRITTTFSPISASRLLKRFRSSGSRPAVGSSTMMSRGLPISACAMPKRWRMPPEKPATAFLRTSHRFTWLQQRLDRLPALRLARHALQHREVVEQLPRGDARVDAEILRQVAQGRAQPLRLADHVDVAEADRARAKASGAWRCSA